MKNIFCIIGTDTGIGKTYVTCRLLQHFSQKNKKVSALKPISSGLTQIGGQLIHEDVAHLTQAVNIPQTANEINPICYLDAIAPHIAAKITKNNNSQISNSNPNYSCLSVEKIITATMATVYDTQCDYLFIEGCGGLLVPLNDVETYLDLLNSWQFPVILVVGMRLGCLNHALLTYECLKNSNVPISGWIANCIDPQMSYLEDNIEYLTDKLPIPLLATVPYNHGLQITANFHL